jgi:hypothetical protein
MAKVKGPLLSMDARGQVGKSLVFLGWKGIKDVRSHVVPANPRTALQVTQRGIVANGVVAYHAASFNVLDLAALKMYASIQKVVMSGFNFFLKKFIDFSRLAYTPRACHGMTITSNTGGAIGISVSISGTLSGKVYWTYNPMSWGTGVNLSHGGEGTPYTATVSGLTVGEYVYMYFWPSGGGHGWIGGLYKVLVLP